MAGDWIKVEHATASKPEIGIAAEMLGISRREMVGLCVDYWIWIDANMSNSCNGFVTHVSRKSIEDVLHCPGLAAVLEHIGWATFDDKAHILRITNWDRHNGKSAKTRALGRDRVKRLRNDSVTLDALPEKRREEKSNTKSNTKAARKRAPPATTTIPVPFELTAAVKAWGLKHGWALEPYLEIFVGRNSASKKEYADWDQAFMNAVREDWYELRSKKNGRLTGGFESRVAEQERVASALTGYDPKARIVPTD